MAKTRSNSQRKRGRPPKHPSDMVKRCPCGGASGNIKCMRAVSCESCGQCEYGCKRDQKCQKELVPSTPTPKKTRLSLGHTTYIEGSLNEKKMSETPPSEKSYINKVQNDIVEHSCLTSPAMMVETMYSELDKEQDNGQHPKKKHFIPFISEVTVVINQICNSNKSKKSSPTTTKN